MATAGTFKNPRSARSFLSETNYALGMAYVETPLSEGLSRVLFNFDIVDNGDSIKPRGGYQFKAEKHVGSNADADIYTTGTMYVASGTDAILHRFVLTGAPTAQRDGITVASLGLVVEHADTGVLYTPSYYPTAPAPSVIKAHKVTDKIHGATPIRTQMEPIYTVLNNNLYLIADSAIYQLYCKIEGGVYSYTLLKVVPDAITPAEAVNYGYNQMQSNPYAFSNTQGQALRLMGILPYDAQGTLKFSARANESVIFKLIYEYPAGATYKVQWEMHDLLTSGSIVLVPVAQSPTYTAPAEISVTTQSPYKRFSIVAKVYNPSDLTTPLKVMQLGSYYLTDDTSQNVRATDLGDYDLSTATGMTVWNRQMLLWGVANAKSMLFRSTPDNPGYFPYPHNIDIFDEDILMVVPYLDRILVWTQTKLFICSVDKDGLVSRRMIRGSLDMVAADAHTVVVIKNMVMFRSGNYYYMVVPDTKVMAVGEVTLAPVYRPIEKLLDYMHRNMHEIIGDAYNIEHILNVAETSWTLNIVDSYSYLDNTQVRNCYIYQIATPSATMYVEVRLNYDTMLRAWSISAMQSNGRRLVPLRQRVTETLVLANCYRVMDGGACVQILSKNILDARDTFKLDGGVTTRTLKNYQYLDTGKRDVMVDLKKRFREIQFRVNNLATVDLEFFSSFILDDEIRTDIFSYTTEQITNPADPNYGQIYVVTNYIDPIHIPGETALGAWTLGLSGFPKLTIVKVRLPISGKGYTGRLKLISKNEAMYELLSHTWVLRHMNAR